MLLPGTINYSELNQSNPKIVILFYNTLRRKQNFGLHQRILEVSEINIHKNKTFKILSNLK